jgi:flagellar basal-body rod protein FlgC
MLDILNMGASGLIAQRTRMDTIANNVLNINTTRNEKGEKVPFRRRLVEFAAGTQDGKPGVHVSSIKQDMSPFQKRWDPGNPDAGADGYVLYPNVDLAVEQVNMLEASRAYEANVTMMETGKAMFNSSLRLLA